MKIWDAETGQELLALNGLTSVVSSVCFSPDGKRIVTGGEEANNSGSLRVWDATQGLLLHSVSGLGSMVTDVDFSPDGRRLVSSGRGRTVKVWLLPPNLRPRQ